MYVQRHTSAHVRLGLFVRTHPNSDIDVVGVDLSPQVLADPLLAQELLEKLGAVFQVVAADPPLPGFPMLDAGGVVARAPLHAARAARFGERMGQRRRGHRQQEGSLLECWDGWREIKMYIGLFLTRTNLKGQCVVSGEDIIIIRKEKIFWFFLPKLNKQTCFFS